MKNEERSIPQSPNLPSPPIPPGGDLIYLGIEPKIDRFCNEVSFGAPIPIPYTNLRSAIAEII